MTFCAFLSIRKSFTKQPDHIPHITLHFTFINLDRFVVCDLWNLNSDLRLFVFIKRSVIWCMAVWRFWFLTCGSRFSYTFHSNWWRAASVLLHRGLASGGLWKVICSQNPTHSGPRSHPSLSGSNRGQRFSNGTSRSQSGLWVRRRTCPTTVLTVTYPHGVRIAWP